MGLTFVKLRVANPADPSRAIEETFLVDSGAVYSLVPRSKLEKIGIEPHSRRSFILANGERIEREIGSAIFEYQGQRGDSLVIFGEEGDRPAAGSDDPGRLRPDPRPLPP